MSFVLLFALVALYCVANSEVANIFENMIVLDENTFHEYVSTHDQTLVLFYDDSMDSLATIPEIQRAATVIFHNPDSAVAECAALKHNRSDPELVDLANSLNIEEWPTLKLFRSNPIYHYLEENKEDLENHSIEISDHMMHDPMSVLDYNSGLSEAQMTNYMRSLRHPAIEVLNDLNIFEQFKRNEDVSIIGFGYKQDGLSKVILSEIAEMYRNMKAENIQFGISYDIEQSIIILEDIVLKLTNNQRPRAEEDFRFVIEERKNESIAYINEYINNLKNNEDIIEPLLIVLKRFDEELIIYMGDDLTSFYSIHDFVEIERYPVIQELNGRNHLINQQRGLGYVWIAIDFEKTDYIRRVTNFYKYNFAPFFKGHLIFYIVDARKYIEHIRFVGIPWIPGLLIEENNGYKYLYDPNENILSLEDLSAFFTDRENYDLQRYIKSQTEDELREIDSFECDECSTCYDITNEEFGLFVENINGYDLYDILQYRYIPPNVPFTRDVNILVEYYAPWDTRCQMFMEEYEKIAKYFSKNKTIMIAKIDATANDIPYGKVDEYPRFVFYKYSDFLINLESYGLPIDINNYGERPIDAIELQNNIDLLDWPGMKTSSNSNNPEKSFYKWRGIYSLFDIPRDDGTTYGTVYDGHRQPKAMIEWIERQLGIRRTRDEKTKMMKQVKSRIVQRPNGIRNHLLKSREQRGLISEIELNIDGEFSNNLIDPIEVMKFDILDSMTSDDYDDSSEDVDPFYNGPGNKDAV